jgi:hypothetical protein
MSFIPISIDNYIIKHLENNPSGNEKNLKERLEASLSDYNRGIKCSCGNDIWVVGSAFAGNHCFSCITGESYPHDDFEIDSAIKKREDSKGRRHIDNIHPVKIAGFFSDDGYEINTDLIKKPSLCLTCIKDNDPDEELLCMMNRNDQKENNEFICFAFEKR